MHVPESRHFAACLAVLTLWMGSVCRANEAGTRIEALIAAHDRYCEEVRKLKELDADVLKLNAQIKDAPGALKRYKAGVEDSAGAVRSAQSALREAEDDYETKVTKERVEKPKYKTVRNKDGTTRRVRDGTETVTETKTEQVRKKRTPEQKAAEVDRAEKRLTAAQANYKKFSEALASFPTDAAALQKEVAEARKDQRLQDKQSDAARQEWLACLDFAGDFSREEHLQAVKHCEAWIQSNPLDGAARLARGLSVYWLGDYDAAREHLDSLANEKWDSQGVAAALRGLIRGQQGDAAGGKADFDRALRAAPREMCVYLWRGLAHCRAGEWPEAVLDWQKAAELDGQSSTPHRLLGLLYSSTTGVLSADKALLHAQKACDLAGPADWSALDTLAAAQAAAGQFEEAAKSIQKAADLASDEKRQLCLDRQKLYQARQPLRLDWK